MNDVEIRLPQLRDNVRQAEQLAFRRYLQYSDRPGDGKTSRLGLAACATVIHKQQFGLHLHHQRDRF
jgi:hypothetical protein